MASKTKKKQAFSSAAAAEVQVQSPESAKQPQQKRRWQKAAQVQANVPLAASIAAPGLHRLLSTRTEPAKVSVSSPEQRASQSDTKNTQRPIGQGKAGMRSRAPNPMFNAMDSYLKRKPDGPLQEAARSSGTRCRIGEDRVRVG